MRKYGRFFTVTSTHVRNGRGAAATPELEPLPIRGIKHINSDPIQHLIVRGVCEMVGTSTRKIYLLMAEATEVPTVVDALGGAIAHWKTWTLCTRQM